MIIDGFSVSGDGWLSELCRKKICRTIRLNTLLYLMAKLGLILMLAMAYPSLSWGGKASSVVWGQYCGECVANCATFYQVDGKGISIDSSGSIFSKTGGNYFSYVFTGLPAEQQAWQAYSWLLDEDWPRLEPNHQIFGQPDAYDQCGLLMFYTIEGHTYKALIDPMDVPPSFRAIVKRLYE